MLIQACLCSEYTITHIVSRLKVNKSTISHEISKYSYFKNGINIPCYKPKGICNICARRVVCDKTKKYFEFQRADSCSNINSKYSLQEAIIVHSFSYMIYSQTRFLSK